MSTRHPSTVAARPRRRKGVTVIVAVAAAAALACVVLLAVTAFGPGRGGARDRIEGTDLKGHTVTLDPGSGLTPAVARDMHATADTGARFQVPSVGLDVPLGALTMSDNTITPPGFASAYQVRNLGVAPAQAGQGTVFVAMHSMRNGAVGPGNYLIDVADQKAKVAVGATIDVAGVAYRVTDTRLIAKTDISQDASVWADTPDRLVVITCLQRPQGGPSLDNLVITASRVG